MNVSASLQNPWKTAWQKRIWRCWLTAAWTWTSSMSSAEILCPAVFLSSRKMILKKKKEENLSGRTRVMTIACTQHWWSHTSNSAFSFGPLMTQRTLRCWKECREWQWSWWREHKSDRSRWRTWGYLAWNKGGSCGDLVTLHNCLREGCRQMGVNLFSKVTGYMEQ